MITCKQVSNALSKEDYKDMPFVRRILLRLHVSLCLFCGKFNKQVIESQNMCSCYKENEDTLADLRPKMDPLKKEELSRLLQSQMNQK
mgnify:CR=1 FL=1